MSTNFSDIMGSSKVKKKHFKPKPQKTKIFRSKEPLLSVLMWGINYTISGLKHVPLPVVLMPDDFKAFTKVRVDNHHFNKENMPSHFKVKEYCPLVFRNLRERFGVHDAHYVNSIGKSEPVTVDESKLYRSSDGAFDIQVLQSDEVVFLHALLKHYHPYVVEKHGNILLPQYLGLYRVTVGGTQTYMVVTRSVTSRGIHSNYSLKGTTVDREATAKEKSKEQPILKDGDFMQDGCKVHVGEEIKEKLLSLLRSDVQFLQNLQLMEYCIYLGIHTCENSEDERECLDALHDDMFAIPSCEGAPRKEMYVLGLSDLLQRKRPPTIVGNLTPDQYANRLLDFIDKAII